MASGSDSFKAACTSAESGVTGKVNELHELIAAREPADVIQTAQNELKELLNEFKSAHEAYHQRLVTETERERSAQYFNSLMELANELETEINAWLAHPGAQRLLADRSAYVNSDDSASNVESRVFYTRSAVAPSVRSTASSKARALAKKAALGAKAATLRQIHDIQLQELKLQQRKAELELQGEIAEVDAETRVYEQVEAEFTNKQHEKPHSTPLAQNSFPIQDPPILSSRIKQYAPSPPIRSSALGSQDPYTSNEQGYNRSASIQDQSFRQLVEIQDRQNNALQQLIQQQQQGVMALTLPQPSLQVFSGNPIDYLDFIRAFEHQVERKTPTSSARLYYLVQHTTGPVQELMKSCLSMREDEGYQEARRLLKERYGQSYKIAAAHVKRLVDGPAIRADDGSALQQFSIQLTSCVNTLREIGYISKLDNHDNLKKIIDRLPYSLRVKWRDTVDRIVETDGRDVTVTDIMKFVTARARAATHPVFGKVTMETKTKQPLPSKDRRKTPKADGFSSQGKPADDSSRVTDEASNKPKPECHLCKAAHWLPRCEKFRKQSLEERTKFVQDKKLCINCLNPGHFVHSCQKESFCKVKGCSSKHSSFLHPVNIKNQSNARSLDTGANANATQGTDADKQPIGDSNAANNGYVKSSFSTSTTVTGMAIVPVLVKTKESQSVVETYAFLDSGSNTSFCTESLLEKLNAKGKQTKLTLTTLQGEENSAECSLVSLQISDLLQENTVELPEVYSRPNLPIPAEAIATQQDVNRWPHLKGVKIPKIEAEIGLLIGSDVPLALQPREFIPSKNGSPFATRTILGWVLNGPLGRTAPKSSTAHFVQVEKTLDQQFRNYCNLEFNDVVCESKTMSLNDRRALDIMEESVKLENGHYEIALPWKTYPPNLKTNRTVAERRLELLKKRLRREPIVHQKYTAFVDDLLSRDYAREVISQEVGPLGIHWYLPHHPVFNPQKPGKIRVVFDCSAKCHGTSLNDQLLQGPDLTNSLVGVLSRFREERIALMSDIEAMFHQVRVRPSDCDALRFLWWPDGNLDSVPREFQMRVHLFGGTSSPSCANFALKKTAQDNKADFNPETIQTVERNFYVDDCLKSVPTEDAAVTLADQLRELLARGGFKLTKWLSNSKRVLESLPESERAAKVKGLDFDKLPVERALGVQWNVSSDTFGFSIVIKDRPATRRGILSIISSVYDPLGFVAPFILKAKLILQDLCRHQFGWDDPIPEEYLKRWQAWLQELPKIEQLEIDRCFKPFNSEGTSSYQLHHFSDASQQGFGAVTYLRITDQSDAVKCTFVMGKSRLAPIKPVTIPRLELSAAVIATRLDRISRNELTLPITESFFWTDSTCVLRYIENQDKRFQTFVANRVATIHDASSPSQWKYVNTQDNPADDSSRGVPPDLLQRWIHGPKFLLSPPEMWPQRPTSMTSAIPEDDPEIKSEKVVFTVNASTRDPVTEIIERFSSWSKLKKIVAWFLRLRSNLQKSAKSLKSKEAPQIKPSSTISPITVTELRDAEHAILNYVQRQFFKQEYDGLKNTIQQNTSKHKALKSSSIQKLDPVIIQGLLRVGGRLKRASLDTDAKHPIILPKDHHVAKLIILYYHHVSGHSGVEYTLSLIRHRYWIINARSAVRRTLEKCLTCRKHQSPTGRQKTADLPVDRVTPSRPPFTFTGVDCFGPFEVRRGRSKVKRYGVIFTCLALRAVHIEVASSLDTESFINALRRFVARRGLPEEMRSDNGGNFVRGERELREAINSWNQSQIHDFLLQRNVKWTFNPPTGSHHGGVWERCIRTVRKVLRALIKEQVLDEESLSTLMCEVEAIVNGRPITKLSDDPRDMEPLTPNHLLLLRAGPAVPPGIFSKQDCYNKRRWRQVQYLADVFWRRWVREYLPSLQERQKWNKKQRNFAVDDIVLVLDDKKPRNSWPLGRILEVYANSRDGLVRSVRLKTSTSELVRPINKIVLLEAADVPSNSN